MAKRILEEGGRWVKGRPPGVKSGKEG